MILKRNDVLLFKIHSINNNQFLEVTFEQLLNKIINLNNEITYNTTKTIFD